MKSKLQGVLIDVDGTLLDSNDAHALAWQQALLEHGRKVGVDVIRPLIGKGGDKLLQEVAALDADSPEGKAISTLRASTFAQQYLPALRPTKGARALLERFVADGVRLIVATSSTDEELTALLEQAGVADLLKLAATSDDADDSKPDPDIVQAALTKSGLTSGQVFMLGDTPYDIQAARAAGVIAIALRCGGHWDDPDFAGAVAIFNDPADLSRHLSELPFYAHSGSARTAS